jgi:hypothetical protein
MEVSGGDLVALECSLLEAEEPLRLALAGSVPGRGSQPALDVVLEGGGVPVADHVAGPPGPAFHGEDLDALAPGRFVDRRAAADEAAVGDDPGDGVLLKDALEGRGGVGQHLFRACHRAPIGRAERPLLLLFHVKVVGRDRGSVRSGEAAVIFRLLRSRPPVVEVHEAHVGDFRDTRPEPELVDPGHAGERVKAPHLRAGIDEGGGHSQPPQLTGRVHCPLDPGAVAEGGHEHVAAHAPSPRPHVGDPAGEGEPGEGGLGDGTVAHPLGGADHRAAQPIDPIYHASTTVLRAMGSRAAIRRSA